MNEESAADRALAAALSASDGEAVRAAIAAGADPNRTYASGQTLLEAIVSYATRPVIDALLEGGATVKVAPDDGGWTALHAAAFRGDRELLEGFLRRGVAVSSRARRTGMTAIETAAWFGHLGCVEALALAGAPLDALDDVHPGPRALAEIRSHDAIVAWLDARGASRAPATSSPWPPRDWNDVPGWDKHFRWAIARAPDTTELTLPFADLLILRALWSPQGPKRRVLVLGNGIAQTPRLVALGGDDVVALDVSPVATDFARDNKIHKSQVAWFLESMLDGAALAAARGDMRWVVGDAREPTAVDGLFDVVLCQRMLHGFAEHDRAQIVANVDRWLSPSGELHVGLQSGSAVAEHVNALAVARGFTIDDRVPGRKHLRVWNFSG